MTTKSFESCVLDHLDADKGTIFLIGMEPDNYLAKFVDKEKVQQVDGNAVNLAYITSIMRKNFKINVLRIGTGVNPIIAFNYYHPLVSEGGIIIIDDLPSFRMRLDYMIVDDKIPTQTASLGKYTTIYSENNRLILRREPVSACIPFGIVIATYYRKNGKSKEYVERALKYISEQSYQNYKVFLIGDKYENTSEFDEFAKLLPSDKIEAINLPIALERETCKIPNNLWHIAGANTVNYGMELAQKQGYIYYVHLDDDDYWHTFHLRNVAAGYDEFPEACFVCTLGITPDLITLPETTGLSYNNFPCTIGHVFHSSYGFRMDKIPFKYITITPGEPETLCPPADGEMLYRIGQHCYAHGYKTLAIPILSLFYDSHQGIMNDVANIITENETQDNSLITQIKRSNSHLIVANITKEMSGKTFHHHYHLLYDLRTLLGREPKNYLEIGVYNGGSLSLMMQHPYETNLTGLDLFMFEGQYETCQQNIAKFNRYGRIVTTHKCDTHAPEIVEKLKQLNFKTDILFIDGDHSKIGTIQDFEIFSPFVNSGGYIVFDDYQDCFCSPEVKPAVDEIVERIKQGQYGDYEIIGSPENFLHVYPKILTQYNEFIIRKK